MKMITTSRYASKKTREFARKAGTFYVSRGKKTIDDIAEYARRKGESEVVIVEEKNGVPEYLSVIEVSETGKWRWGKRTKVNEYEG